MKENIKGTLVKNTDRIFQLIFFAALAFLLFSAGVLVQYFEVWPSGYYTHALEAYQAQQEKQAMIAEAKKQPRMDAAKLTETARVITTNADRMQPGTTLVCGEQSSLFLIDAQGKLLHSWALQYYKAFPNPAHITDPVPDASINCVSAYAYPSGDVLVVYHAVGDTPYGYGLAKLDRESRVIWSYSRNVHHDVYVADDGTIYTLTQEFVKKPIPGLEDAKYPILADGIAILDASGKERDHIPLLEAFLGTPYEEELKKAHPGREKFDYIHTNSIMPLEERLAAKFPMFEVGDLLVSARNYNLVFVVSPKTKKVKWGLQGGWRGQHHARFLDNGAIQIFDNNGFLGEGKNRLSRLLEVDPASGDTSWTYIGKGDGMFYTDWNGSQESQPNGNVLIIASKPGRLLEVARDKQLVWSYTQKMPIYSAHRYAPDYFVEKFLKP